MEKVTIDCTPTWEGLLPMLLVVLQDGNSEGKKTVADELRRMAKAADKWNEHCKIMNTEI